MIKGVGSGGSATLTSAFIELGTKVAFEQRSDDTKFYDKVVNQDGIRQLLIPATPLTYRHYKQLLEPPLRHLGL